MTYLPQHIWKEIAKTQQLDSKWANHFFSLQQEIIDVALDNEAKFFERLGVEHPVILCFFEVVPLLAEHNAITKYILEKEAISLRRVLPEVLDIEEAIYLVKKERYLSTEQEQQLKKLLEIFYKKAE